MRKALVLSLVVIFALTSLTAVAMAKDTKGKNYRFESVPRTDVPLAPDMIGSGPSLSSAVADTFHLAWYSFDVAGQPNPQGWVCVELTAQLGTFFHVASGAELDGGTFGNLVPLAGAKSVWCGVPPSAAVPFCGYFSLPGYGNTFDQLFCTDALAADSICISYTVFWDSEPGYDATTLEWSTDNVNWNEFAVGDTFSAVAGVYDGTGPTPSDPHGSYLSETFYLGPATTGDADGPIYLRFHFNSDGAWSDEDGLWPTDGAITLDNITVDYYNDGSSAGTSGTNGFEGDADGAKSSGIWTAKVPTPYPLYCDLYPGVTVTQEDPCFINFTNMWGFFDDPANTNYSCHTPNPLPLQGAMPFGINGLYMRNEIWSPRITNVGAGVQYNLLFQSYRDLPLDNLQFYVWHVRPWNANCPGNWGDFNFVYYGGQKDWLQQNQNVSTIISASDEEIQLAVGSWDMCGVWCGIYGTGACHSHAPLIDQVHLLRVNVSGPQYVVRHLDLFQDNFADDGTLTGTARGDAANDIALSSSPTIQPGDSVTLTVTGIVTDPITGVGPSVYAYVAVWPQGQPGKAGVNIEAPETRAGVGKRYPLVDSIIHDGVTWYCFRLDSAITTAGAAVADRYAIDLNDELFTPGDTICYVFCADDGLAQPTSRNYFSRTLDGQGGNFTTSDLWVALNSPMEFTILPAGGWLRDGDILYVDDSDDRGGPVQLYFDTAFDMLGIRDKVDRYDVLGPSSVVANSLASRVKNQITQIRDCYRKIIWCSGNLSTGLIGDGTGNPEKSDDYGLLFFLLDTHPDNPGVYISGDDVAEEWVSLAGAGAVNLRSQYMTFNLANGNHVAAGEPISPLLTAVGPCFIHLGVPDVLIAYGGCPAVNDFDLLTPTGTATAEMLNVATGNNYVISQATPNAASSVARVVLSGFSYHYINTVGNVFPPARVEHLRDILLWLQNIIALASDVPDGTDVFANRLDNNYPNPFNPTTTIRYSIKEQGNVSLKIYNAAGQLVRTLVSEMQTPRAEGFSVVWDGKSNAGSSVSSGVYFYKLTSANFSETKKMVLLK